MFDLIKVEVKAGKSGRKGGSLEALHGIESLLSTAAAARTAARTAARCAERIERKTGIQLHLIHVLFDDLDALAAAAVDRPLEGTHAPPQITDHR